MTTIELIPTLDHCIETTARQEFKRAVDRYLEMGSSDTRLEARIELLRSFLENADFKRLRSESEKHLMKGERVVFLLWEEGGKPRHEMRVEP